MIRAKFHCTSVSKRKPYGRYQGSDHEFEYDVTLNAVYDDGNEENAKFFAATPSGEIKLATLRADLFEPGATYYIDFTKAPPGSG